MGAKILEQFAIKGRASKGSPLERFRKAFPTLISLRSFIECFAQSSLITSEMMKLLKTKGLNAETHQQSQHLIEQLPKRSKVRKRLNTWLAQQCKIQQKLSCPALLVNSDILESLFGQFKHILERSPQADMNRSVLLIPALCGKINDQQIIDIFKETPHAEIKRWEDEHIPYTVRKQRQNFFANKKPKTSKILLS